MWQSVRNWNPSNNDGEAYRTFRCRDRVPVELRALAAVKIPASGLEQPSRAGKGRQRSPTLANFIYRLGESCLEEPEDLTRRLSYQQCFGVVSKGAVELIFLSMFCF
jgi:hypothetical protein